MQNLLTAAEIAGMVRHWASTPPEGFLGSDYGNNLMEMLHLPMSEKVADSIIEKLKRDVPILATLPPETINLYMQDAPGRNDARRLMIEIAGELIPLEVPRDSRNDQNKTGL